MADCSKTLDYSKELKRMCDSAENCSVCPFALKVCEDTKNITQNYIDVIQKWSDENPIKTR